MVGTLNFPTFNRMLRAHGLYPADPYNIHIVECGESEILLMYFFDYPFLFKPNINLYTLAQNSLK